MILSGPAQVELFMKTLRMGRNDTVAARAVLLWHAARLETIACPRERFNICQNISKVLGDRSRRMSPADLQVGSASSNGSFRRWLTATPARERHRPLLRRSRLWESLRRWPVSHLGGPAVVCFERAIGRLETGVGGVPSAEDVSRVVATRVLPTAVVSPADHYVLLRPGSAPRFLSVGEVARSFGIPRASCVFKMLMSDAYLSPIQAVSCLGAAVQVDVARVLVRRLRDRGLLAPGVRYGSACSGWIHSRARSKRSCASSCTCSPARLLPPRGALFSGRGTPLGSPPIACSLMPPPRRLPRLPLWGCGSFPLLVGLSRRATTCAALKPKQSTPGRLARC